MARPMTSRKNSPVLMTVAATFMIFLGFQASNAACEQWKTYEDEKGIKWTCWLRGTDNGGKYCLYQCLGATGDESQYSNDTEER